MTLPFAPSWLLFPLTLYPLWEATHVRIRETEFASPRLPPEWDGATLLFLSDSHTHRRGRRERLLEHLLTGVEVDLLLLGGDLANDVAGYEVVLNAASHVTARLGRYAIWGNSENLKRAPRPRIDQFVRSQGYQPLDNASRVLERRGAPLALCGVGCPYSNRSDFDATFHGLPPDLFRILLMHAPQGLLQIGDHRADLILSGHTHGGQIRVPGLKAFNLHTQTEVDLDRGFFGPERLRDFWPQAPPDAGMIISTGIGTSTVPVRVFCPPEVLRITLRRT